MKILSAAFVASVAATPGHPGAIRDDTARVAFVGRSNVGKSSLLNALMHRQLARTSAAAGKTRTTNTYRVEIDGGPGGAGRWACYLIDLPGYGYARGGADSAIELSAVAARYFDDWRLRRTAAKSRDVIFLLVDARHPGLELDRQAYRWLSAAAGPPQVLATKADTLSRSERTRNLGQIEEIFAAPPIAVSARKGEGLKEIWSVISSVAR